MHRFYHEFPILTGGPGLELLPDCVLRRGKSVHGNSLLWPLLYRLNILPASPTGGYGLENSVAVSP